MTNKSRFCYVNIDDFDEEKEIVYDGETYLVRDNGAVYRKNKTSRIRKYDNQWTFGSIDTAGYLTIAGVRIHILVATAFLEKPNKLKLVVDHIDTNRQNNRVKNLRWVTRLENIILNPITREKIEFETGVDIMTFLNEPEKYRALLKHPSLKWMHTLTREECDASINYFEIMKLNANKEKIVEKVDKNEIVNSEYTDSLTPNAKQKDFKTPTEFLNCPINVSDNSIVDYYNNVHLNTPFNKNAFGVGETLKFALCDNNKTLYVILHLEGLKHYGLLKIYMKDNLFIHQSLGNFFSYEGALKQFTLNQGLEWTGGDSIDDFC